MLIFYRAQSVVSIDDMEIACEDDCDQHNIRIALEQAMETLPDDEREVLFLRYINDMSVKEIADILQVSRFAIYRKEKHALKLLREKLERRDFM